VEITNVERKEARAYLKSGDAANLGGIPKGRVGRAARIREEHGGLRSSVATVRQKFKDELTRQEADLKATADALVERNAVRPDNAETNAPAAEEEKAGAADTTFNDKRGSGTCSRMPRRASP
jgi:hypothetical protein